jgi:hypothetical protein
MPSWFGQGKLYLYPFRIALRVWTICGKDYTSRNYSGLAVVVEFLLGQVNNKNSCMVTEMCLI